MLCATILQMPSKVCTLTRNAKGPPARAACSSMCSCSALFLVRPTNACPVSSPEADAFQFCQGMAGWHDEHEAVERERQQLQRPRINRIGDDPDFRNAARHRLDRLRAETFVQIDVDLRMVCEIAGKDIRKELRMAAVLASNRMLPFDPLAYSLKSAASGRTGEARCERDGRDPHRPPWARRLYVRVRVAAHR